MTEQISVRNKAKSKYFITEVLCVAALIVFIVVMLISRAGGTTKSIDELTKPVVKIQTVTEMSKKSTAASIKAFDLDSTKIDSIAYYKNDNIMDVSEVLIIKFSDENYSEDAEKAVEKHIEEQKNLFKNYAPDQYALLEDSILKTRSNTLFYCTSKDADKIYDAFKSALK